MRRLLSSGDSVDFGNPEFSVDFRMMAETNFAHPWILARHTPLLIIGVDGNHEHHAAQWVSGTRNGLGISKEHREGMDPKAGTIDVIGDAVASVLPAHMPESVRNIAFVAAMVAGRNPGEEPLDDVLGQSYAYNGRARQFFRDIGPLTFVNINTGPEYFHFFEYLSKAQSPQEVFKDIFGYLSNFDAWGKGLPSHEWAFIARQMHLRRQLGQEMHRPARFVLNMHYGLFYHSKGPQGEDDYRQLTLANGQRHIALSLIHWMRNHTQLFLTGHTHYQEEYAFRLKPTKLPIPGKSNPSSEELQTALDRRLEEIFTAAAWNRGARLQTDILKVWDDFGIIEVITDGNKDLPGKQCPGLITAELNEEQSSTRIQREYGPTQIAGKSVFGEVAAFDIIRFNRQGDWSGYEVRGLAFADDGTTRHVTGSTVCEPKENVLSQGRLFLNKAQ